MSDIFNEYLVKRKNGPKQFFYKALIALAAIAVMAAALYFVGVFSLIIICAVGVGVFFAYKEFEVEYEYILTNNELDIDRITSRERRRNVLNADVKKFEILAPVKSEHASRLRDRNIRRTLDFSSGRSDDLKWFAIYDNGKGEKTLLYFEPPRKMRDGIRTFVPRAVMEPKNTSGESLGE